MNIKNIITATLLFSLTACTDYLDIQPYGRTIPKTPEEFSALVHSLLDDVDSGLSLMVPGGSETSDWDMGGGDDFEVCLTEPSGSRLPVYQGNNVVGYSVAQVY